jgi:endonuclease/exonuclease/phosphatase family metal-dependent hydrolase
MSDFGVRLATWNLEWASPTSARGKAGRRHLESVGADVVVTTEDHRSQWDRFPHVVDAGGEWGYPIEATRRKVIAWSAAPWTDVRTIDHGATRGRLVAADTTIGDITATVVAVCIPWAAAHVSTGRRDRERWGEHLEFCASLGELLVSLSGAVVVAGDFNQTIPRRRQPQRVHDALIGALDGNDIVTAGETAVGPLIDHIAVGSAFTTTDVTTWPNVIDGTRISDHAGVAARIV